MALARQGNAARASLGFASTRALSACARSQPPAANSAAAASSAGQLLPQIASVCAIAPQRTAASTSDSRVAGFTRLLGEAR